MALDALSTILPAPPVSQDGAAKAIIPAVSGSASSDRGSVSRRVEASPASASPGKMSPKGSFAHVDERV